MSDYAQYLRIERLAGGVTATRAQIVRASHKLLGKRGRSSGLRKWRHAWINRVLVHHTDSRKIYREYSR